MKEEKTIINGLEINYKIAGEGPAILVLHGWGGASDSWLKVQKIISEQGYKVICPDFPGFGKTPPPPDPWDIGDYANLILNFTQKLGLDRFFLLGHSFGGRISIKFATQYPEKIKKLILCDSAGIKPKLSPKTHMIFWLARIGNAIFTPKRLTRFKDSARNLFYLFLRNKDYVKANGVMRETIKKIFNEDLLPDLSKIKVKTLIVWGEIDKMVPLKYGYIFKENIKDSELKVLPDVGHSPHLEAPEGLSKIIMGFFK